MMPHDPPDGGSPTGGPLLPGWLRRSVAYGIAGLVAVAMCWVLGRVLLRLALVSFTMAIAILFAALLWPLVAKLRRWGMFPGMAALVAMLLLVGLLGAIGLLMWTRVNGLVADLGPAVTAGLDHIRVWLTTGPLDLDPAQVSTVRDQVVSYLYRAAPGPVGGARTALNVLAACALALFAVFFFLKDGPGMWRWVLKRTPQRNRARVDGAGQRAWGTLTGYIGGVTLVALIDAVLIGAGLFFLGVPLWLSLTLLTFIGAFVPYLGATLAGAVAALVTLVTNGGTAAVIALMIVLVVQQVEGNLLHPLLVGKAVKLHAVVILVAFTSGFLLLGIPGAILAVPLVAVGYQVAEFLRTYDGGARAPGRHCSTLGFEAMPTDGDGARLPAG